MSQINLNPRIYDFTKSNAYFLINNKYEITPGDSFFVKNNSILRPFDPNETRKNHYKLCYWNGSVGEFFNPIGFDSTFILPQFLKTQKVLIEYDIYQFRVGCSCDNKIEMDESKDLMIKKMLKWIQFNDRLFK